jgi:hypothetical protein
LWTVDCWLLATLFTNHSGASRGLYPPLGVTGLRASSTWVFHVAVREGLSRPDRFCGGRAPGELSGGKWMSAGIPHLRRSLVRDPPRSGAGPSWPRPFLELLCPSGGAGPPSAGGPPRTPAPKPSVSGPCAPTTRGTARGASGGPSRGRPAR